MPTAALVHEDMPGLVRNSATPHSGLASPFFSPQQATPSLCSVRPLSTVGGDVWIYVHTGQG